MCREGNGIDGRRIEFRLVDGHAAEVDICSVAELLWKGGLGQAGVLDLLRRFGKKLKDGELRDGLGGVDKFVSVHRPRIRI